MSLSLSPRAFVTYMVVFAAMASAVSLQADVIYTNFGTGDAYAEGAGMLVTSDGVAWSSVAIAFTPAENYTLSSIEFVATDLLPGDTDPVTLAIFADNGTGQPSLAPLESFTVGPLGQFGDAVPVTTVTSLIQPLLLADTQYWIGLNAAPGDLIVWNQNLMGANGFSETDGSGNWSTSDPFQAQGAVEIDGILDSVVTDPNSDPGIVSGDDLPNTPEPDVFGLMATGLAMIALLSRLNTRGRNR